MFNATNHGVFHSQAGPSNNVSRERPGIYFMIYYFMQMKKPEVYIQYVYIIEQMNIAPYVSHLKAAPEEEPDL